MGVPLLGAEVDGLWTGERVCMVPSGFEGPAGSDALASLCDLEGVFL